MAILKCENISHEFGGLRALNRVSLEVSEGQIFGVIGPNGAGKTTLFNIISGIYIPTEGQLYYQGQPVKKAAASKIARLGIGRTFQNIRLFKKMSVLDNVRIGCHGVTRSGLWSSMLGFPRARREERDVLAKSLDLLAMMGLEQKRNEYASSLAYGEQRRLEIARALALNPKLLLLDEPAAGMNRNEKGDLSELIHKIRQEMELSILLVEHDMELVMGICDEIAVLDYGALIARGTPEAVKQDERVIQSYLGVGI